MTGAKMGNGGRSQEEIAMDDAVAARIEGKLDVMNERQQRFIEDMTDARTRLNGHSERLNAMESWRDRAEGMSSAVKLVWIVGGAAMGTILTIAIAAFSYMSNGGG